MVSVALEIVEHGCGFEDDSRVTIEAWFYRSRSKLPDGLTENGLEPLGRSLRNRPGGSRDGDRWTPSHERHLSLWSLGQGRVFRLIGADVHYLMREPFAPQGESQVR
jgi:hypothetical protein